MKTIWLILFYFYLCCSYLTGQTTSSTPTSQVIEGGKLVVELIKVFGNKKDQEHPPDCHDAFADLCIENKLAGSLSVSLLHRFSGEQREVVVLPGSKECCLQAKVGIWTYDLKMAGNTISMRKGDLKIEGCNNMVMSVK